MVSEAGRVRVTCKKCEAAEVIDDKLLATPVKCSSCAGSLRGRLGRASPQPACSGGHRVHEADNGIGPLAAVASLSHQRDAALIRRERSVCEGPPCGLQSSHLAPPRCSPTLRPPVSSFRIEAFASVEGDTSIFRRTCGQLHGRASSRRGVTATHCVLYSPQVATILVLLPR